MQLKQINKNSIKANRLGWLVWALIICGILGFLAVLNRDEFLFPLLFTLSLIFFLSLIWFHPLKVYRYTFYGLVDDVFYVQKGKWFQKRIAVAQNRIQHTDVQQGPIERRYDLATLTLHTAGMKEADIEVSGLLHADAIALRDHLLIINKRAVQLQANRRIIKPVYTADLTPDESTIATTVLALVRNEDE